MVVHSLSWIDQEELERALHRAGVSQLAGAVRKLTDNGYWPELDERPAVRAPEPARAAGRAKTHGGGELAIEPYHPPEGQLGDRLEHYLRWVVDKTGCSQIFVADADGLVLLEVDADPDLVAISSMFVSVLNRVDASLSSPIKGSVVIDLEVGESLHVVQAETGMGPYALGFAVSTPAPREAVERAREGLVRVMSGLEDDDAAEDVSPPSYRGVPKTTEMNRLGSARPDKPTERG